MLSKEERDAIWERIHTCNGLDIVGDNELMEILNEYTFIDECTTCISHPKCSDCHKGKRCEYYHSRYGE